MKRLSFFLVAIFLISCNPNTPKGSKIARFDTDYAPPVFPKEYKREITALNRDLLLESFGGISFLCDSVFIIRANSTDNEHLFQALSIKDGHQITSFGNQGRANYELSDCRHAAYDNKAKHLYAMDMRLNMIDIDLGKALSGDSRCVVGNHKLEGGWYAKYIHYLPNNRILHVRSNPRLLVTDMTGKDTLALYDDYHSTIPEFDNDKRKRQLFFAHNTKSAIKPDGTKIFHATMNGMTMEIFDFDGTTIKQSALRQFFKPAKGKLNQGTISKEESIYGARRCCATDKYIYLLYSDNKFGEGQNPPFYLGVFNWNGNEVCRYVLNEYMDTFVVTPDDKRLYCWAYDSEDEEYFGYFDLK